MKKLNLLNFIIASFVVAVLLASCSGVKKMQKQYDKLQFKATPEVLQTKGGKIKVNLSGKFPEKYFSKKAKMVITPVLKYEGGSTPLNAITLKGEKVPGDGIEIKNTGGSFSSDYTIDYLPAMLESKLVIQPKILYKEKPTELGELKVADGVIITETRIDNKDADIELAKDEYQKITIANKSSDIYFPYSKSNFDKNLKLNKDKEKINKINEMEDFIKKGWKIQNIDINAWASPEGEDKYNENLSKERASTTQKFLKDFFDNQEKEMLKALKKAKKPLPKKDAPKVEHVYNVNAKGEDKEGFVAAVKSSDIKDKNAIINVIESEKNKVAREKKIKDMTVIYAEVEKLLEPLRRGEMSFNFLEPKRTDEQIAELSTSHPDSLDINEILYAATLTKDMNTKLKIYKSAATLHADNWKAYNNAGYSDFKLGNYDEAGSYFEKANTLSPNNGIILNNLGAVALAKNNFESAKSYYESAKTQGINTDYNLGIVLITQGDYEQAVKNFESKKCSYNLALAQLLLDNTTGAKSTLDCAEKNGEIYYLMAVIGARTQNAQMMNENLKNAIQIDPKYRKQAKTDREFIKFFNNADFMEITKF
jgi:tetratricopeptide (TPR) repeat protein/outer membrane protein OmpA-like peptidoglycan-associated protein